VPDLRDAKSSVVQLWIFFFSTLPSSMRCPLINAATDNPSPLMHNIREDGVDF